MGNFSFDVTMSRPASAERAFELVRDAPAWPRWGGVLIPAARWQDGGATGPESVVGRTRLVLGVLREHVTEDQRPQQPSDAFVHGYRIDSNSLFRDYAARLELRQDGDIAHLHWSGSYVSDRERLGKAVGKGLESYLKLLAAALLKAAAQ